MVCALYAMPNLYGEDHAIQISASRNAVVNEQLLTRVESTLAAAEIETNTQ